MPHDSSTPEPTPMGSSDIIADHEAPTENLSEDTGPTDKSSASEDYESLQVEVVQSTPDALFVDPTMDATIPPVSEPSTNASVEPVEIDGMEVELAQGVSPDDAFDESREAGLGETEDAIDAETNQGIAPEEVVGSPGTVEADSVGSVNLDGTELVGTTPEELEQMTSTPASVQSSPRPQNASPLDTVSNLFTTIARLIQQGLQAIIPLSRAIAILILRFVIQILQLLLDLLEGTWQSRSVTPPATAGTVGSGSSTPTSTETSATHSSSPKRPLLLRTAGIVWNGLIKVIRAILPNSWNQKLPTPLLNLLLAVFLALGLWTTPSLLFSRSVPVVPKSTIAQENERPPVVFETDMPDAGPQASSLEILIPLDPVVSESGELMFERPQGVPASQQKAISALQERLSKLRDRYDTTPLLIQSVRVDPTRDRLTVELSDDWYTLLPRRQDQLINDLWARSQQADLPKLLVVDSNQTPLARSPIVGTDVVVLQRQESVLPTKTASRTEEIR